MPIQLALDKLMDARGIGTNELSRRIGITPANLSRIKMGKCKEVKCSTLHSLCIELDCQPGDILTRVP